MKFPIGAKVKILRDVQGRNTRDMTGVVVGYQDPPNYDKWTLVELDNLDFNGHKGDNGETIETLRGWYVPEV